MRLFLNAVLVMAFITFGSAASAQPVVPGQNSGPQGNAPAKSGSPGGLITQISPQQLSEILKNLTLDGKQIESNISIQTNADHESVIKLPFWGERVYSGVVTQDCNKNASGCRIVKFFANFGKQPTVSQNWINDWNQTFIAVEAFRLKDGELVFVYALPLLSGVTSNYLLDMAGFFKAVVDRSFKFKPQ